MARARMRVGPRHPPTTANKFSALLFVLQDALSTITREGFDVWVSIMGGALGAGAYFSSSSGYSHGFSQRPNLAAAAAAPRARWLGRYPRPQAFRGTGGPLASAGSPGIPAFGSATLQSICPAGPALAAKPWPMRFQHLRSRGNAP
jgi:hypothetical protein